MTFTITTLTENTVYMGPKGLKGEHGLSFLIETGGRKVLFDTGQTSLFAKNAEILNIGLSDIDTLVFSHGHYDHTGGLKHFSEICPTFTLTAHPDIFRPKLAKLGGAVHEIGIPVSSTELEARNITLRLDRGPVDIGAGMTTTGEIPMLTDYEEVESMLCTEADGEVVSDPLADDQALILDTPNGTVVVFGCAHRGAVNTLKRVAEITGKPKIHAVMGGLHLGSASNEKMKKIIEAFRAFGIEKVGVGHCTGHRATATLVHEFKDRVFQIGVGQVISF